MRLNHEGARLDNLEWWSKARLMPLVLTIGATFTGNAEMPPWWLLNPGASARDVLLPSTATSVKGLMFFIRHTGATAATDLTVKDSTGATTFGVVGIGQTGLFYFDGSAWDCIAVWSDSTTWNMESGTATAVAGAATLNANAGMVTSEALTTAQNALYTLTLTNSFVAASDIVFTTLQNGTNTQGTPVIVRVTPGSGSLVIVVKNMHDAAQALNGTIKIGFAILKA